MFRLVIIAEILSLSASTEFPSTPQPVAPSIIPTPDPPPYFYPSLQDHDYFRGTFATALAATGLLSELTNDVTIFVPTDSAFSERPEGFGDCFVNSNNIEILKLHIVTGIRYFQEDYVNKTLHTISDEEIVVKTGSKHSHTFTVNGASSGSKYHYIPRTKC